MTEQELIAAAVAVFMEARHREGDTIPHKTVQSYLQCKDPQEEGIFADESQRRQLVYMQRFGSFKQNLLVNYKIALVSDHGAGYKWLPSVEQVEFGVDTATQQAQKALRKGAALVEHVDLSKLGNSGTANRANSAAHLSNLQGVMKQPKPKLW